MLFAKTYDLFCKSLSALSAFCPNGGQNGVDRKRTAFVDYKVYFPVGVGRKAVYGHNTGQLINRRNIFDMAQEVGNTFFKGRQILICQLVFFKTAMAFFNALTVATITTASGLSPAIRHFMSKNFSAPRSAPKPASVMV